MDFSFLKSDSTSIIGWILAGLASAILGLAKLRTTLAAEKKDTNGNEASSGVIEMLRVEINRLADQNTRLAKMVNSLQLQVIALRNENMELRDLIQKDTPVKYHGSRATDKKLP